MIENVLPVSTFEMARDRLSEILSLELANQKTLAAAKIVGGATGDELERLQLIVASIPDKLWVERTITFGQSFSTYLNLTLLENPLRDYSDDKDLDIQSSFGDQTSKRTRFIMMMGSSSKGKRISGATVSYETNEAEAAYKLHCLAGIIRNIMMHPIYSLLNLQGYVTGVSVSDAIFTYPEDITDSGLAKRSATLCITVQTAEGIDDENTYPTLTESSSEIGYSEQGKYYWITNE